jgi:hypothetical protein
MAPRDSNLDVFGPGLLCASSQTFHQGNDIPVIRLLPGSPAQNERMNHERWGNRPQRRGRLCGQIREH